MYINLLVITYNIININLIYITINIHLYIYIISLSFCTKLLLIGGSVILMSSSIWNSDKVADVSAILHNISVETLILSIILG